MHLCSHNGPIDVLVCPETDVPDQENDGSSHDNQGSLAFREGGGGGVPPPLGEPLKPDMLRHTVETQLDVSLSSMASHDADLDGLMPTFPHMTQSITDQNQFLPTDMFESLTPPLDEADFYHTLSPTEGILELFDLA